MCLLLPLAAIRQAIAKSIVAFYQKYVDEASKKQLKDILLTYDRTLLVADPRRCEPKKCALVLLFLGSLSVSVWGWRACSAPSETTGTGETRRGEAAGARFSAAEKPAGLLISADEVASTVACRFGGRAARAKYQKS